MPIHASRKKYGGPSRNNSNEKSKVSACMLIMF